MHTAACAVFIFLCKRPNPSEKHPYQRISAGLQPWLFYPCETPCGSSAKILILLYCRTFASRF